MSKLLIKNGLVFDPINNIEGEIKDILIENGFIVEKFSNQKNVKEIDANNKVIVPSAMDIHTHVASQQVNWVKILGKKNKAFQEYWNNLNLEYIAREYISNGYTFIVEANVYPTLAKHTIFNFKQLPVLDKAMLLNISNIWAIELEYQREMVDEATVFLSDLLKKTKGFGFKVYNPFEAENWNFKKVRDTLTDKGRLYNFSPLDVYEKMVKYNEVLGLPHSVHVHIEGYEQEVAPENLMLVLNKLKALNINVNSQNKSNLKRSQIFHLAHAGSYNITGDNLDLISFYNKNQEYDLDLGVIGFDPINPLITCDRRLINSINSSDTPFKLITINAESEGDSFSTFRTLSKKNKSDCILWANSLDLALNIQNKWQVQLSVNFPNYAHIKNIPEIATWLMSKQARDHYLKDMHPEFIKGNSLSIENKELTFNEFVIISRASPAKSLGLGDIKGNLGLNADADLNILDLNLNEIDISKNYDNLKKSLENIEYVIKNGEIVKKQNNLNLNYSGSIFWSKGKTKSEDNQLIINRKKDFYQKYASMFYDSLNVSIESKYLREIS